MSNRTYYLSDKVEDINYGELVYVAHSSYEGEWASISHTHVLCEMFLVIGGEGTIYIEDQKLPLVLMTLLQSTPMSSTEKSPVKIIR